MDLIGVERERGRDVATGIVLGTALGLAALFLYLDTTKSATTGAAQQILFGSIFTVDPSTVPLVLVLSAVALAIVVAINRPLLLSSLSAELTRARGINLRGVALAFMVAMAVSVGLSSIAVGSILSTALLIGPAATSVRVTRSLRASLLMAAVLGDRRDLARDPLRVRQFLLDPVQSGSAGQLLHRVADLPRLPRCPDFRSCVARAASADATSTTVAVGA